MPFHFISFSSRGGQKFTKYIQWSWKINVNFVVWSWGSIVKFVNWSYEKPQEISQSDTENFRKNLQSIMGKKKKFNLCANHVKKKKLASFTRKSWEKIWKFTNYLQEKIMKFINRLQGKSAKFMNQAYIYIYIKIWVLAISHKKKNSQNSAIRRNKNLTKFVNRLWKKPLQNSRSVIRKNQWNLAVNCQGKKKKSRNSFVGCFSCFKILLNSSISCREKIMQFGRQT